MTIANELNKLNASKQAIKAAIESKGQAVGSAPLDQYASKIDAITTGGGVVHTNQSATPWVRPADWLPMPTMPSGSQICILAAVYPDGASLSFNCGPAYTVDWGDGSAPQNFASTTVAQKIIPFESVSPSTMTSRGYRQVMVKITPQSGDFTFIDLGSSRPIGNNTSNSSYPRSTYLDVDMQFGDASSVIVSSMATGTGQQATMLERVRAKYVKTATNLLFSCSNFCNGAASLQSAYLDVGANRILVSNAFQECRSLQEPPTIIGRISNFSNCFSNCSELRYVPNYDTTTCTLMDYAFYANTKLVVAPNLDTSLVTNFSFMFTACYNLQSVPQYNTSSCVNFSNMFNQCYSLKELPPLSTTIGTDFSSMFRDCYALKAIPPIDTQNAVNIQDMFRNCFSLTVFPDINTAKVTNASGLFGGVRELSTWRNYDFSKVTNAASMFVGSSARAFPDLDLPEATDTNAMFSGCRNLIRAPMVIAPKTTNIMNMFATCTSMVSIPQYNFPVVASVSQFASSCFTLREFYSPKVHAGVGSASSTVSAAHALTDILGDELRGAYDISLSNISYSKLEGIFNRLGHCSNQSHNITANTSIPGFIALLSKSNCTTTLGSKVLTISAGTSGIVAGMSAVGTNIGLTTVPVSFTVGTPGIVNRTAHNFPEGMPFSMATIPAPVIGIDKFRLYYVRNPTADGFNFSETPDGPLVPLTGSNAGSFNLQFGNWVVSVDNGTQLTLFSPATASSGTVSVIFRPIQIWKATLRNYTITAL